MSRPDPTPRLLFDDLEPTLHDEVVSPASDGIVDTEAAVRCPWCSSRTSLFLDPGSGPDQVYAEDCPVCCRAWSVTVRYGPDGGARVELDREDDL